MAELQSPGISRVCEQLMTRSCRAGVMSLPHRMAIPGGGTGGVECGDWRGGMCWEA
jgi:hypothetical protein